MTWLAVIIAMAAAGLLVRRTLRVAEEAEVQEDVGGGRLGAIALLFAMGIAALGVGGPIVAALRHLVA